MSGFGDLERRLAGRLRPTRVPGADDTWRRIAPLLDGPNARREARPVSPRVAFVLAAVVTLVLVIGIVLAVAPGGGQRGRIAIGGGGMGMGAASPSPAPTVPPATPAQTRTAPVSGITWNGNVITSLQPPPPFIVFQPALLTQDMQLIASAYSPGSAEGGRLAPSASGSTSRSGGWKVEPAVVETATQRGRQLLGDGREATVVLIYAASPEAFVELVQRPARDKQLPIGDPTTIRNLPAVFAPRDGRDVLAWVEGGTFLELYTTLGRGHAVGMATGLRPTALTAVTTPVGVPTAAPPAWVNVPLAQRRGAVTVPQVDRQALARQCGEWHPNLYAGGPPLAYQQATCVARFVAGADDRGNAGVSRYTWHEAAERLGLDMAAGPAGDPGVWLVQVNVSERGGGVVVLDADTGDPYLLVELLPLP